jgi:hypothetical protein
VTPAVAAGVLAAVHLFGARLRFLSGVPRSHWLSGAGGVSVAYVFVHLLPEISEAQEALDEAAEGAIAAIERHVYLIALLGLAVFYGLELAARRSRREAVARGSDGTSNPVFWIHMLSYSTYNALIGYLLVHRIEETFEALALFTIAMALHFVVNDFGLRDHHREAYTRVGRWLLALALFVGVGLAFAAPVPEAAIAVILAFIAGGVVLNVLKEELPEDRQSRFTAFAAGAAIYAALLLAV